MMRSLYSGVSGLKNHQTRMDVIGDNMANINTTGFKGSRVTFQDMLSQTMSGAAGPAGNLGGINPKQVGLGMGIASIDQIFTNGNVQATGKNTDLCLSGSGFFIVSDGAKDYYTRNGAFEFDKEGNYVLPGSGMNVKGWMADALGNISSSGLVENIKIPVGQTMAAKESTKSIGKGNLSADGNVRKTENKTGVTTNAGDTRPVAGTTTDADGVITVKSNVQSQGRIYTMGATAPAGKTPAIGDPIYNATGTQIGKVTKAATTAAGTFEYTMDNPTGAAPTAAYLSVAGADQATALAARPNPPEIWTYDAQITTPGAKADYSTKIIDSLGVEHTVVGTMEKISAVDGMSTTWVFIPKQSTKADGTPMVDAGGNPIYRDDKGADISIGGGTPGSMTLKFDNTGKMDTAGSNPTAIVTLTQPAGSAPNAGAKQVSFTLDFSKVTGYGGSSTETAVNAESDGYTAGVLDGVTLNDKGMIIGGFTNGQSKELAKVALATFNNPTGLEKNGGSLFSASSNSGDAKIGSAGGEGGTLTAAAIEMSNVNMSEQMSDMIVTQRGFQSNSKLITVSDEMIETLVNLKR